MKHSEKEKIRQRFIVKQGAEIDLSRDFKSGLDEAAIDKEAAVEHLAEDIARISHYQDILFAQNKYSLLIIFQAMDAAGKDGTIKHVMSGVNPQGCQVYSFAAPSSEELDHDYLWRCSKALPERGRIGIFNRSYYEEVLVARVHPSILEAQHLPEKLKGKGIWKRRFEQINNFEKYLVENGTVIIKIFLNVSKKEQKKRFLARLTNPEKNWKFSSSDALDRDKWDQYMDAYQDCLSQTSTPWAPWHVIPADSKPFCRLSVGYIIAEVLKGMDLQYPQVSEAHKAELNKARLLLEGEDPAEPVSQPGENSQPVSSVDASPEPGPEAAPETKSDSKPEAKPKKDKAKKDKSKEKSKNKNKK